MEDTKRTEGKQPHMILKVKEANSHVGYEKNSRQTATQDTKRTGGKQPYRILK